MNDSKERLVTILKSFGIKVEDITESRGNTVTLYEMTPSLGCRISKIRGLKDEIAVGLQVPAVRVVAPTASGKVGIEVPNAERRVIPVKEALGNEEYLSTDMALPLSLGTTTTNEPFLVDLAEMPHLLVAGATGQGKSVGLNVTLLSLLNKRTPDELRLILIDPKRVELSVYSKIRNSYLAAPVITDNEDATQMLNKVCEVMEYRYEKLSEANVRNISEYNKERTGSDRMPYLVVVIDEYGDIVMTSGKNFENAVCRIAQKARAVGIHLILSTQRPAATIVTGNIKANFPARLAFRTITGTDSRVILDQTGAEKLAGKGDFIFFNGADTVRAQCAFASTEDVEKTCDELTARYPYGYKDIFTEKIYTLSKPLHPKLEEKTRLILVTLPNISLKCMQTFYGEDYHLAWQQLQELGIITRPLPEWMGGISYVTVHDPEEVSRRIRTAKVLDMG